MIKEVRCGSPPPYPPPYDQGNRMLFGQNKLLFCLRKWILKVAPVAEGAIDEELRGLFCGLAGSSGTECAARSDRVVVHRSVVDAERGDQLRRHGAVCPDQGVSADAGSDVALRAAEPRHLQPGVSDARPAGLRTLLS